VSRPSKIWLCAHTHVQELAKDMGDLSKGRRNRVELIILY